MSAALKAHGLDGKLVEPDWPALTRAEIRSVLDEFSFLRGAVRILSVSPRPFSAASVVAARSQRVFVKRHASEVRNAEGLGEEHRFMQHLHACGFPVAQVLVSDAGESAIERGEWTYEVHRVPDAIDLYAESISWTPFFSAAHARSAGEILARLHLAAEGYDAPARSGRPLVAGFTIFASPGPETSMQQYVAERPALTGYLHTRTCVADALELLSPFHNELLPLLPALAPLWTHNDLHPSNLLWSSNSADATATAVIDFGLSDRTNAVHDLAQAIERSMVDWLALVRDPLHPERVRIHYDHLRAFLDGYESVRPLTPEEAAALAPLTALCHAEFALSETDYFLRTLHSEEKAWFACEGYLVAHAAWFRGPGEQLLQTLRDRARTRPPNLGAKRT